MKTQLVSVRLPEEDLKISEQKTKEEKMAKATALKQMLALGIKQYQLARAVERYGRGKTSLGKAAEEAGLTVWEMMDCLKEKGVPNPLTAEDFRQSRKNLEKALQ